MDNSIIERLTRDAEERLAVHFRCAPKTVLLAVDALVELKDAAALGDEARVFQAIATVQRLLRRIEEEDAPDGDAPDA